MTCCGSCCHRDIPRCADVFSLQSPDLLKMTSHPPLALPLGELSPQATERANGKPPFLALSLGELSAKLTERASPAQRFKHTPLLIANPHLALPLGELSPQATERACAVPFLSYFKKNSDIKIAFEKTECYNILYITLHF